MSKRAEQRALEAYPEDWQAGYFDDPDEVTDDNEEAREYFQQGYEQAEKDLALTLEDVLLLMHIWTELPDLQFKTLEAIAEETLKRFNEQKNGL